MSGYCVGRYDFFRIVSDGEKILLLRDNGNKKECYVLDRPVLTNFNLQYYCPTVTFQTMGGYQERVSCGLPEITVDLTLEGGSVQVVDKPLIMGVDIFDKLSITDYLDIINEKIKQR